MAGGHTYLGSRVAAVFLERDYEVTCLAHENQETFALQTLGAEIVRGSVLEPERWRDVLKRCNFALNLTDHFDLRGTPRKSGAISNYLHRSEKEEEARIQKTIKAINLDGQTNFIDTCVSMDVDKILTLSSIFALGDHRGAMADENSDHRRTFRSYYERVMYDALFQTRRRIEDGAQVACVLPGPILGPRAESPFAKLVESVVTGRQPWVIEGPSQMTFTYIDDIVRGIFQLLDRRAPMGLYVFGNDPITWADFWKKVEKVTGQRPREGTVPEGAARLALKGTGALRTKHGQESPIQKELLDYLIDCQFRFSSAKAKREIGWDDTTMDIWLAELVEEIRSAATGPATQAAVETFRRPSGIPAGY
jgi:nucleoside-diphosphate-sugar epimerase